MLREALEETNAALDLDLTKWVLALSGGYDSRSILYMLRDAGKNIGALRTVTWGLASAGTEKETTPQLPESWRVRSESPTTTIPPT